MDEAAALTQTKVGEPTQEEIDNSIQLTQIGSEIKMSKKSSMYLEQELEKKKHHKKEAKKVETKKEAPKKADGSLSDETEKLLAEASAALEAKPDILKKAAEEIKEAVKPVEVKKPEVKAEVKKPEAVVEDKKPEAKTEVKI